MTKEPSAPFGNLDQKGDASSPFMDYPSTERACHSPLEPLIISLRPTLRGLDAVSVSTLNHDQGMPWMEYKMRSLLECYWKFVRILLVWKPS